MPYSYNKLRGRIVEKYGTISAFAPHTGLSRVSVSAKLNGATDFTRSEIERWSKILDIKPVEYHEYFFS